MVRLRENIMRFWDQLWFDVLIGLLVALVMGVILIGGGGYAYALHAQATRKRERLLNELLTGVKVPPPTQKQADRDWQRDFVTGTRVGGVIWFFGAVYVFWDRWKKRRRYWSGRSMVSPDEGPLGEGNPGEVA